MLERLLSRKNRLPLFIALLLWAAYASLALLAPLTRNTYHLTLSQRDLLQLTIIIPVLIIWVLAMNGAVSFLRYAVILAGAWKLRDLTARRLTPAGLAAIVFPYAVLGVLFGWLFANNLAGAPDPNGIPKFAMPGQLPLFTVAIPYIFAWVTGILAITVIAEYARTIHGTIYRRALKDLVRGLIGVLFFSILLQLIQLSSGVFAGLRLGTTLLILYVLIILYAIGFMFIARGAHKLSLIEESL
jgi:hypothetical protein